MKVGSIATRLRDGKCGCQPLIPDLSGG